MPVPLATLQARMSAWQLPASRWKPVPQVQRLLQLSPSTRLPSSQVSLAARRPSPQKAVAPAALAQLALQIAQAVSP